MSDLKQRVDQALEDVDFTKNKYQVSLETTMGSIVLNLDPSKAPEHCRNMIGLARNGFYDGLIFHRVISGFMIQGGCPEGSGMGGPGYHVKQEFNDRPHEPGVLSMARAMDPDSAGSQFFICLEKVPHLDGQYTAFGATADDESLAVVKKIGAAETGAQDRPVEDIQIIRCTVTAH